MRIICINEIQFQHLGYSVIMNDAKNGHKNAPKNEQTI